MMLSSISGRTVCLFSCLVLCLASKTCAAGITAKDVSSALGCQKVIQQAPTVPDALGVNIHFTDPRRGEMKMLSEGGFRWVRMDFSWSRTEKPRGEYDFTPYDRLLSALEGQGTCALFILDYSNNFYDHGLSPKTDEGRQAFARWAAAAVHHFQGHGIYWEMYNEPNIKFWRPEPNVTAYIQLALAVGHAIREAAADETYIGPATSTIDFPFLESCFKAGLLEYWSAVSVHPYRQSGPETAADEFRRLRELIARYAPPGKRVPILSGEWGYSSAWKKFDEARQGKMLARQWLTNLANDIPLSIWYDWHDDGTDPGEPEHHFGTVANQYYEDRDPAYDAKPAYLAARTISTVLKGYNFSQRIKTDDSEDYAFLFAKDHEVRLAVWSTLTTPHEITIPISPGRFSVISHTGEKLRALVADKQGGLSITVNDAPVYLVPETKAK